MSEILQDKWRQNRGEEMGKENHLWHYSNVNGQMFVTNRVKDVDVVTACSETLSKMSVPLNRITFEHIRRVDGRRDTKPGECVDLSYLQGQCERSYLT